MKKNSTELLDAFGAAANIGITLAACIAIGFFGGRYLDEWLHTSPLFMLGGALLGVVSGFWSIYKRIAGTRKDG